MIVEFSGRSAHYIKLSFEKKIAVRQSSGKEMTQLAWSNESCEELRKARFDETAISTGARQ